MDQAEFNSRSLNYQQGIAEASGLTARRLGTLEDGYIFDANTIVGRLHYSYQELQKIKVELAGIKLAAWSIAVMVLSAVIHHW